MGAKDMIVSFIKREFHFLVTKPASAVPKEESFPIVEALFLLETIFEVGSVVNHIVNMTTKQKDCEEHGHHRHHQAD